MPSWTVKRENQFMMKPLDKSNALTGAGVSASGVGSLVSILAFALPYWIYYDEDLTLTDGTGSHRVQWTYYYGFWNFCNKVSSDISNSDKCGSVESHSDVEQTTSTLLLLAILLFISGVANGCLYLTIFKKEKLCLYISWISVVFAGILAVTSIVLFSQADHSHNVTSNVTLKYSPSKLYASFWLVVVACLLVVIATVFITLAIINVHRTEDRPDDKKSMVSYDSVNKQLPDSLKDNGDASDENEYSNAKVAEAFPYTKDSPYSTSSESFSESDDSFDSDDSDIEPEFAKLKVKVKPKQEDLEHKVEETLEARRCKSGDPQTMARLDGSLTPKSAGSSIPRSRSASALTPIEQTQSQSNINAFAENPFYTGDPQSQLEQGRAPLSTSLIFSAPCYDSDDAFVLRRAKTEMPFTQRMKDTIDRKPKQIIDTAKIESEMEQKSRHLQQKTHPFPKKPKKSKRKRREPTEEELRRIRELTDIYGASPTIPAIYPPQKTQKSAPWSSARSKLPLKTSTFLKMSMQAYGVKSISGLPKVSMPSVKNGAVSVALEDSEINGENSSNA